MEHHSKLLLATGVGLVLSDIIPTPADALYFKLQQKWKAELEDGTITPKQYWTKDALAYYGLNPIWWMGVLGASFLIGKTDKQRIGVFVAILAGGAVFGVLNKNIKKDTLRYGAKFKGND
jgi:uncharacterized membrane protein YkvI